MRSYINKYLILGAIAVSLLTACANDDDYSAVESGCINAGLTANKSVDAVLAQATSSPVLYESDDIIEAFVTSSDERGAFFKVISLQTMPVDGFPSIGFSVAVDRPGLFSEGFVPGVKVYIKLKDLYTAKVDGALKIGALFQEAGEADQVGRIDENVYSEKLLISTCERVNEDDLVQHMTVSQALSDSNLNKLIELHDVQFTGESFGYALYDASAPTEFGSNPQTIGGATNHNLEDAYGNTIIFRTSSFANFAGVQIPEGSGSVRGVLTKFGSTYQFLARYESDIMFGPDRLTPPPAPFYIEDFQAAVDNTDFNIPGWVNFVEAGTRKWSEQTFQGTGYAEFSSFGSGSAQNIGWLVSPAINMDAHTGETLSFIAAQHHLDVDSPLNALEVYIFTSFNGTDVLGATKVNITDLVSLPTSDTEWYEFVNSGQIDLSNYTGNIYIAFRFIGSGTDTALDGAFQIDNLAVSGN